MNNLYHCALRYLIFPNGVSSKRNSLLGVQFLENWYPQITSVINCSCIYATEKQNLEFIGKTENILVLFANLFIFDKK